MSKRMKFLSDLKEVASSSYTVEVQKQMSPIPNRSETPIRFSKDFTEEDLHRMTQIVNDVSGDEKSYGLHNYFESQENSSITANVSSEIAGGKNYKNACISTQGDGGNNYGIACISPEGDGGNSYETACISTEDDGCASNSLHPFSNNSTALHNDSHDDPTFSATMLISPQAVEISSTCRNEVSVCDSPSFSPYIAQQMSQLGCTDLPLSPATPITLLPAESSTAITEPHLVRHDIRVSQNKRQAAKRKDVGRLRTVYKDQWLDVKRKTNKNLGKAYNSRSGKLVPQRSIGPTCKEKCKLKCSDNISEPCRKLIFDSFWAMGDIVRHWDYINKFCDKIQKRRITTDREDSRRQFTIKYYLPVQLDENVDPNIAQSVLTLQPKESKVQVCKTMFLNTFGIKQGFVYSALNKLSSQGTVAEDKRGRNIRRQIVITDEMKLSVCDHVHSFAPVESHYVRQRTTKLYLDGSLTFARMFLLYKDWEDPQNHKKVLTARQYRDIVNKNINLEFHAPKKDQCDVCHVYKNLSRPATEEQTVTYTTHIRNKTIARELKNKDKESAILNSEVITAVYDFQKVHGIPYGETSILYYKRKLSVFNFTIFNMKNKIGHCFVWDESIARRGANEVSSCLYDFIEQSHRSGIKVFNFWSDNCGGQNRNRIVFATYMRAAHDFKVIITHKYLEKGHTQNEGDSVHALIEREAKNKMVYTPEQWYALIRWAKHTGNPYIVKEMMTSNFIDFKSLITDCNWAVNADRQRVYWSHIRQLKVLPDFADRIFYKTDFCDHDFKCIIVNSLTNNSTPRTRSRNRPNNSSVPSPRPTVLTKPLNKAYTGKLPLPQAKIQDLQYLCNTSIIPSLYHNFYTSLIEGNVSDYEVDDEPED